MADLTTVEIKVRHLPPGQNCPCPWEPLKPIGFTVHSTGTLSLGRLADNDETEANYFHSKNVEASAHIFVDYDSATELLPWQPDKCVKAWHAGGVANRYFIAAEMCEQQDPVKHQEMYRRYVWIVANACFLYGWQPDEQITVEGRTIHRVNCHDEISKNFPTTTNHCDPEHYLPIHDGGMDKLRQDVKAVLTLLQMAADVAKQRSETSVRTWPDIANHWAREPIEHLANTKPTGGSWLVSGRTATEFRPNDMVSRAEFCTVISRVLTLFGK